MIIIDNTSIMSYNYHFLFVVRAFEIYLLSIFLYSKYFNSNLLKTSMVI